jgi:hypothetical protein
VAAAAAYGPGGPARPLGRRLTAVSVGAPRARGLGAQLRLTGFHTPAGRVRNEVEMLIGDGLAPALGEPFLRRPRRAVERLADSLAAYWEVALAPHWPRVRALLEADLLYRSRRLTEGGPTALSSDLDPDIHWRDDGLEVEIAWTTIVRLDGRGLLLVPTVFPARPVPSRRPTGSRP